MKAEHVPQVAALEKLCFSDPWSEMSIASELQNIWAYWLVAVDEGVVAGYIGSQSTIDETDAIIVSRAEAEQRRRRAAMSSPFAEGHTRRYLLCAACLTAMSFFVDFSLYFRLMAAACIMMAAAAWWANKASA